jgi:hypothetical protein
MKEYEETPKEIESDDPRFGNNEGGNQYATQYANTR